MSKSQINIGWDAEDGFGVTSVNVGDEPSALGRYFSSSILKDFLGEITLWANDVADWVKLTDLWENSSDRGGIPGESAPESVNTPFTADEQGMISARLKVIADVVKETYRLTADQSAKLDEKFEEAEKAAERMGRKDWGLLFGGAVFSLILANVITPGVAGHILMMIEHGLGHLFTGGTPSIQGILGAGQD